MSSKTVQFRHDSIPQGIAAIQTLGAQKYAKTLVFTLSTATP